MLRGVHGFAQVYQDTGDKSFCAVASRMAAYFESRRPSASIVFHDLDDPAAPAVPCDTSAQAIAAGGALILAECASGSERARWIQQAEHWLAPLIEREVVEVPPHAVPPRGLLTHGCKSWRKQQGVVSELVFGDYYFVDALMRSEASGRWETP